MRNFHRTLSLSGICLAALFGAGAAGAQVLPQSGVPPVTSTLLDPAYGPKGVPVGAFRLYPTLNLAAAHDDNVFRTEILEQSSTYYEITPRLALQSQWAEHYLVLRGGLTDYEYPDLDSESRTDWDVNAEGRLDVMRGTALLGGASYRETFELRGSPDTVNFAAAPTGYNAFFADARIEHKPNRLGTVAGVLYSAYRYDPTAILPSGFSSNADRDYDGFEVFGRLSYDFSPGYSVYGHAGYITRDHILPLDRNGVNRDSDGWRGNVGLAMELTRLITGEAYFGYLNQNYPAPLSNDVGFNYGANLEWSPDPLILVHFNASHTMNETVLATVEGIATDSNENRFAVGVDYSFRRNIMLRADFAYLADTFTDSGRTDRYTIAGAGASYLINQYMNAYFRYERNVRYSNQLLEDYSANTFWFGLGLQV